MTRGKAVAIAVLLAGSGLGLGGCSDDECLQCLDRDPPAVPTGVFSVTGDEQVTVYWNDIYQADLAGYAVYRDDNADGQFEWQADLDWDQNYDETTGLHWYVDGGLNNGRTYSYAVASFDAAGNESELSFESVMDTPRPEGFGRNLFDDNVNPQQSWLDFGFEAGAEPPPAVADVVVRWVNGIPRVAAARPDVSLQDYGSVMDDDGFVNLDVLSWAPLHGWSGTGDAELILGHAYVVRIGTSATSRHYAKFAVNAVAGSYVTVDWAYQTVNDLRELKAPPPPSPAGGRLAPAVIKF